MNARLLWPDRDLELGGALNEHAKDAVQDLDLDVLFRNMAGTDEFLLSVVRTVMLDPVATPESIRYRQEILRDCIEHLDPVRGLYAITLAAHEARKDAWSFGTDPGAILYRSRKLLERLLPLLRQLRSFAEAHRGTLRSSGFSRLFATVDRELDEAFFREAEGHVERLRFPRGALLSASLGPGNKGSEYTLRTRDPVRLSWTQRIRARRRSPFTFELGERDESGRRALNDLQDQASATAALALERSTGHILHFMSTLRGELGFYLACVNLWSRLEASGLRTCFPMPLPLGDSALSAEGLYEVGLALRSGRPVVPNDLKADGARLLVITGANQGGKSTFLRSIGVSLVMMQSGMFVPARRMSASVGRRVFTHFKREEDASMESGKFDEELKRMSRIVRDIHDGCFLLCNESFASTNEREGAEIADQVVRALTEEGVRIFFVTHLFDLADRLRARATRTTLFLRAERADDGRRTFRMVEGPPLSTSFGGDLYRQVFPESENSPRAGGITG